MQKQLIQILLMMLSLQIANPSEACTPILQKTNPPKLINGEWVQQPTLSKADRINADIQSLHRMNYDFIFSGFYNKKEEFYNEKVSHIETKRIWRGNVPKLINVKSGDRPSNNNCETLKSDNEYIFFGNLGNRSQPLNVKVFRLESKALIKHLGKPKKQWIRGRLIKVRSE